MGKTSVLPKSLCLAAALLASVWADAAVRAPIVGEIERIGVADPADPWSRGVMVVGGRNVIIPRNLIIQLPANRLTLQQLVAQAPAGCLAGETGLSKADSCSGGRGAIANILANRTDGGDLIAGDVFIEKGTESATGTVTYINYTDGYFRLNGNGINATQIDDLSGVMVRINDPDGVFTLQQGLDCGAGPNCSPDPRFGGDPENYTSTFVTGYPLCLPSTVVRGLSPPADANGDGDAFCPQSNRPATTVPPTPAADSRFFAPLKLGDNLTAQGNIEVVSGVRFLSAHTVQVHAALTTQNVPTQPDYMIFSDAEWGVAGFQNQFIGAAFAGFTTLESSQLDLFALHHDTGGAAHEIPLASTVGNPGSTFVGVPPTAGHIFEILYEVSFLRAIEGDEAPCVVLASAGLAGCPGGPTIDLAQNFAVLSPVSRDVIARTRHKRDNPAALQGNTSFDINGNPAPNGQYLTPVHVLHPLFGEINVAAMETPFIFAGQPWNLDRRLGPQGCDGLCEGTPQPLDPFPFSSLDPRTQASVPATAANRILSFFPFGAADVLPWPPDNPPPQGIVPTPHVDFMCVP